MNLALDDHRVDLGSAVVDGDEPPHLHLGRSGVDVNDADVGAERVGEVGRVVADLGFETAFDPFGQVACAVGFHGDVLDGDTLARVALHLERSLGPFQVGDAHLQHAGCDDLSLVLDLSSDQCRSRPGDRR